MLGWASAAEIGEMKALTHKVNAVLKPLFAAAGIDLVDYKLEFGHPTDDPDGARWCSATNSRRTAAGYGTRRPAKNWTRIAFAAISAA